MSSGYPSAFPSTAPSMAPFGVPEDIWTPEPRRPAPPPPEPERPEPSEKTDWSSHAIFAGVVILFLSGATALVPSIFASADPLCSDMLPFTGNAYLTAFFAFFASISTWNAQRSGSGHFSAQVAAVGWGLAFVPGLQIIVARCLGDPSATCPSVYVWVILGGAITQITVCISLAGILLFLKSRKN